MRSIRYLLVALVCKLQTVTEIMYLHTGIGLCMHTYFFSIENCFKSNCLYLFIVHIVM